MHLRLAKCHPVLAINLATSGSPLPSSPNCYLSEKALFFFSPSAAGFSFCVEIFFLSSSELVLRTAGISEKNIKANSFGIVKKQVQSMKLSGSRLKTNKRKYFFTQYIIKLGNSLLEDAVKAQSINTFKKELGKFMEN